MKITPIWAINPIRKFTQRPQQLIPENINKYKPPKTHLGNKIDVKG